MKNHKYELTPEHRARFDGWNDRWIELAFRTAPQTDGERDLLSAALVKMYALIDLPAPSVVFVRSPFEALKVAATHAATSEAPWDATSAATRDETRDATRTATWKATRAATRAATSRETSDATWYTTHAATWDHTRAATFDATLEDTWYATRAATWDPTRAVTLDATEASTRAATLDATHNATREATRDATRAATHAETWDAPLDATRPDRWYVTPWRMPVSSFGMGYGNQQAYLASLYAFFRDVAELPIDWDLWELYEATILYGGPNIRLRGLVVVSDFPIAILHDVENNPHCEDGPFTWWADGSALFSIHGVRVPAWVVLHPERITLSDIAKEENAEVKRIMRMRYGCSSVAQYLADGWDGTAKYLTDSGARIVDMDTIASDRNSPGIEGISRALVEDSEGHRYLIGSDGSTPRVYVMRVDDDVTTCAEAHNSISPVPENKLALQV